MRYLQAAMKHSAQNLCSQASFTQFSCCPPSSLVKQIGQYSVSSSANPSFSFNEASKEAAHCVIDLFIASASSALDDFIAREAP